MNLLNIFVTTTETCEMVPVTLAKQLILGAYQPNAQPAMEPIPGRKYRTRTIVKCAAATNSLR